MKKKLLIQKFEDKIIIVFQSHIELDFGGAITLGKNISRTRNFIFNGWELHSAGFPELREYDKIFYVRGKRSGTNFQPIYIDNKTWKKLIPVINAYNNHEFEV